MVNDVVLGNTQAVARGLASRLRLKLYCIVFAVIGIVVARGLASRLRLKHEQ